MQAKFDYGISETGKKYLNIKISAIEEKSSQDIYHFIFQAAMQWSHVQETTHRQNPDINAQDFVNFLAFPVTEPKYVDNGEDMQKKD